jgi:hypothetical protein
MTAVGCGTVEVNPPQHSIKRREKCGLISLEARYVSFELRRRKRTHTRGTETFPNEREAKKFARAKLIEAPNVTAGTLNPHLPKRTIAAAQMLEWLEEPDEAGLA